MNIIKFSFFFFFFFFFIFPLDHMMSFERELSSVELGIKKEIIKNHF